jgi:methylmalonyl-CoA mutase, C-terminal domain
MSQTAKKVRILVAKPGLDGHDRGAKVVARALRDAGHEVIYTGLHLSIMSGAHMTLMPKIAQLLNEKDASDIRIFGGGIIPNDDIELKTQGIDFPAVCRVTVTKAELPLASSRLVEQPEVPAEPVSVNGRTSRRSRCSGSRSVT